jgi:simple sugar transport system ATP-binding protein
MPEELLRLQNIYKSFGNVKVLKDINININKGEVVALIGDNGAGKSTLIKVITGVHKPSTGKVFFKKNEVNIKSVAQSRKMGIEAVYQERALCDQQELWRNIFAGREITNTLGFLDVKKQRKEAEKILRDYIGFTSKAITVDSTVMGLSGGEKQGVAFGRSLYFDSDLIVLDEPTMGLSIQETAKVLNFVKGLKEKNKSAIFIDHNIIHVYGAADRFIILDRGEVAGEFNKDEISRDELVQKMIQLHESGKIKVEA